MAFIIELWSFLKVRKKMWMLPLVFVMGLLALLVFMGSNPVVAPFIYTLF